VPPSLSDDERKLLEALAKARQAQPSFPGFAPAAVPAAIVGLDRTLLISHPDPPAGFNEVSQGVFGGPREPSSGATAAVIGSRWCASCRWPTPAWLDRPSSK